MNEKISESNIVSYYIKQLNKRIFKNKDILKKQIIDNFKILFNKIINEEEQKNKGKIQCISISLLRVGFKTQDINCIIEAYNEKCIFDNDPISYKFKLEEIYYELYELEAYLKQSAKKYINKDFSQEIEELVLKQIEIVMYYFVNIVRYAIEEILRSEEFNKINKEKIFFIMAGEYMDKNLIIYSNHNTYKDAEIAIQKINEDNTLRGRIFKEINITDKKYTFHDFMGSNFDNSVFENIGFIKCNLAQLSFKYCSFKNVDFEGSILHDTFFDYSKLDNVNLKLIYSDNSYDDEKIIMSGCIGLNFLESNISNSIFTKSILNGTNFAKSRLKNVDFSNCKLKECNFNECNFENVCFEEADLTSSIFNKDQLSKINLSKEQLQSIKLI